MLELQPGSLGEDAHLGGLNITVDAQTGRCLSPSRTTALDREDQIVVTDAVLGGADTSPLTGFTLDRSRLGTY